MPQSAALRVALAVLGGWLAVMPHAVLTVAVRLRELDPSGLPVLYSTALAVGWLALMAGLAGFGALGDALERRQRSRSLILRIAVPAAVGASVTLLLSPSPRTLAVAWVLAQLPAAAVISTALAMGGTTAAPARRGLLSALVGAAPILALVLGAGLVRALDTRVSWAFLALGLLGAALMLPLAVRSSNPTAVDPAIDRRASSTASTRRAAGWVSFTVASFLLSWATSATNGYVVLFIDETVGATADAITSLAATTVSVAGAVAVLASLASSLVVRGRRSGAALWSVAALVVAGALTALVVWPAPGVVLAAAAVFGVGFGLANGAELAVLLFVRHQPGRLGRDLGVFTAATTLPYVLVPAAGAVLLAGDAAAGLRLLFGVSALLAAVGAVMALGIALRPSRRAV